MNTHTPTDQKPTGHPSLRVAQLVRDGIAVDAALDIVFGRGTYQKLASELYEELRTKQAKKDQS